MYVLVLLCEKDADLAAEIDHESFIDVLIEQNLVLLGGPFRVPPVPGVMAAYVLRCQDLAHAEVVVGQDPLITGAACTAIITGWDLVGVNTAAIDPDDSRACS